MDKKLIARVIFALSFVLAGTALWADEATDLLLKQAHTLEGRGRIDLATQTWRRVLMTNPNQPEALAGMAKAAQQNGKLQEAERFIQRLRAVDPAHPGIAEMARVKVISRYQARLDEAQRLTQDQQYESAMQIFREVFGEYPPPGGWAISYCETEAATPGGWESATNRLESFLHKYPDVQEYKLSLGRLWTYRPETRIAGMRLLEAVQGDRALANKTRQAWRQALVWEGANPASISSLRAYLNRYPDQELQAVLAEAVRYQASQVDTGGLAEKAGYEALKSNELDVASEKFRAVLKINPKSPGAHAGLGFVAMKREDFAEAVRYFEIAAKADPNDKVVADALESARFWTAARAAELAVSDNDTEEAIRLYTQALEVRPNDTAGLGALGGAYMKQGDFAKAVPLFEKLVKLTPGEAGAWHNLVSAKYFAQGSYAALSITGQIPQEPRSVLSNDLDYLVLLASMLSDAGQIGESKQTFEEAMKLVSERRLEIPRDLRLQIAGLLMKQKLPAQAAAEYERIVLADPANLDAWEGLISALALSGNQVRAFAVLHRMPKTTYEEAANRPAFLRSVASVHRLAKRYAAAEAFLEKALEVETDKTIESRVNTQLQLAQVRLDMGKHSDATGMMEKLAERHPENADIWKGLIAARQEAGESEKGLADSFRIPATVITRLLNDPDYVSLMAAVYNSLGRYDEGLQLVNEATAGLLLDNQPVPTNLQIQKAWLLLNSGLDERELYDMLKRAHANPELTLEDRTDFAEIWSVWSRRSAQSALLAGDLERAVSILVAALRVMPEDNEMHSALAGALMQGQDPGRALVVYKNWGLQDADEADYAGAVGAAMALQDRRLASRWLQDGLQSFPKSPQLLRLAGQESAMRGDYKKAEAYWRAALAMMPEEHEQQASSGLPMTNPADVIRPKKTDATEDLGRLLLAGDFEVKRGPETASITNLNTYPGRYYRPVAPQPSTAPRVVNQERTSPTKRSTPSPDQLRLVSTSPTPLHRASAGSTNSRPAPKTMPQYPNFSAAPTLPAPKQDSQMAMITPRGSADTEYLGSIAGSRSSRQEVEDQIAAYESRNSPSATGHAQVSGRSGEPGLEKLTIQTVDLESSFTMADKYRFTVVARPIYLDGGTPDGQSEHRFGLLPAGATFGQQTDSGLGAELQFSTKNLGLMFGSTPRGFATWDWTGGARYTPGGGPLTLLFSRDRVRETMLSFSGTTDPVTNQVWGGVMANAFSARGEWGDEESGFYADLGFQYITGHQVQKNNRIDGSGGGWWKIADFGTDSLTLGANMTALHYDKNLRYFTLGHGGYFSPQQYFLFNVPVTYKGIWNDRLQYSLSGSVGAQHIQEDGSPYFPTLPEIQGRKGPMYEARSETGAHYGLDATVSYQVTPHWLFGGWIGMDNTRGFTWLGAGFQLKYLLQPRPVNTTVSVPSIPDWTGRQRF